MHMTLLGFGRIAKDKFLTEPKTFSIGLIEPTDHSVISRKINQLIK